MSVKAAATALLPMVVRGHPIYLSSRRPNGAPPPHWSTPEIDQAIAPHRGTGSGRTRHAPSLQHVRELLQKLPRDGRIVPGPQAMSSKKNHRVGSRRQVGQGGVWGTDPRIQRPYVAPYRWSVPAAEPRRIGPRDHPSAATRTKLAAIWQAGDTVDSSTGGL